MSFEKNRDCTLENRKRGWKSLRRLMAAISETSSGTSDLSIASSNKTQHQPRLPNDIDNLKQ
jgi:hypothetical protein